VRSKKCSSAREPRSVDDRSMNVLDLFSGIGGFSLGLERAGMRTVAFCERDEYCRAVLRKHWPDVPCFDDIHTLDADRLDRLGRIDLVCGGFPCQPFSVAGEQKGKADDRHLWPEMCRVIALARPTWVIGENVAGLVTMVLDEVLTDLESLGYTTRTFVIPAAAVGAPHRRDRLWIIATNANRSGDDGASRDVAHSPSERQPVERHAVQHCSPPDSWQADQSGSGSQILANTNSSRLAVGKGKRGDSRPQFTPTVGTDWWKLEPDVGRVAHGVPRRVDRLRCLGNAVVPQIVEEIGRAIMLTV
jgi:DNA (cytosine-5)-methyltransferase 1